MVYFDSDFSQIEETNCYCSKDSAQLIREKLKSAPLSAIHYLGTGDYHYCSLFWTEKIQEDFALILFDQHPDDQASAFDEETLSCGSWVAESRRLPHCKADLWINGKGEIAHGSMEDLGTLPVYISVDLDILSEDFARTDWDQGDMRLCELKNKIEDIVNTRKLIGADICGGITESKGGSCEDMELNSATIAELVEFLSDQYEF